MSRFPQACTVIASHGSRSHDSDSLSFWSWWWQFLAMLHPYVSGLSRPIEFIAETKGNTALHLKKYDVYYQKTLLKYSLHYTRRVDLAFLQVVFHDEDLSAKKDPRNPDVLMFL
jgi:hypothetical protein